MQPYGLPRREHTDDQSKGSRAREKAESRRRDYEDLESGKKTLTELQRENTLVRAEGAVMQPAKYSWQLW